MVYVRVDLQDLDVSLREAAAAALDDAGWTPEEWHRTHRAKPALRRAVKLVTKQRKEDLHSSPAGELPAVSGRPTPLEVSSTGKRQIPPHVAVRRATRHVRDALRDLGKPSHVGEAVTATGVEVQHHVLRGLIHQ